MATKPKNRPFRFVCELPSLLADTSHLSAESFGVLMRLRMAYWRNGPIADDNATLARIVGMQMSEWKRARPDVELYFEIADGQWVCWTTHKDLEDSFNAIKANQQRTEKARLARLEKRIAENGSHKVCDRDSDNVNGGVCSNVLIGSIQSLLPGKREKSTFNPALAKAGIGLIPPDDAEVLAAVSDVEKRCGVIGHV